MSKNNISKNNTSKNKEDNLLEQFKEELNIIYQNFNESFSNETLLDSISRYQIFAGGKRVRPLLIFIVASLFSSKINEPTTNFATSVELLHNATLIHDDIIDDSIVRRSKPTVKEKYGDTKAILSGDYLLAFAFDYAIDLPKKLIVEIKQAALRLIQGEFKELDINLKTATLNDSLSIMKDKTSSLFSLCAMGGYLLNVKENDFDNNLYKEFKKLGELIGVCFQIADDILDITASKEITGKKQGIDFIEKKPSIIVSLWLNKKTKLFDTYLNALTVDDTLLKDITLELKEYGIIREAYSYFDTYYNKANELLLEIEKNYLQGYLHDSKSGVAKLQNYLNSIKNYTKTPLK
ncbi:MAG: polyprenyl synthetase family protein [Bdellovibrionota bacterium]